MSCARFTHPFEIRNPILVREKHVFAPVATLRDMVRYTGGNDSGKPGHDGKCIMIVIKVCVAFILPAAKAELIVSGDRHLLDLKEYDGIRVVTAANAVREIVG